jgi:hypothetical protein
MPLLLKNTRGRSALWAIDYHDLVEAHLRRPDYTTTWQDLAEVVGKVSYRGVNARYGAFAREPKSLAQCQMLASRRMPFENS